MSKLNTPRTDEAIKERQRAIWGSYPVTVDNVSADFARSLEEEINQLRSILAKLVAFDDRMNDEEYEDHLTFRGAYYAYYKGNKEAWDTARNLLKHHE